MKKTNLVLGFMLIILLALSTGLMAQTTATAPNGSGTEANPYLISNLAELSYLCQNLGAINYWASSVYIKQTVDFDASATQYWDDADDETTPDGDKYNDPNDATSTGNNEGFSPIGITTSLYFNGSYDGDDHTIDSLFINRSTDYIGLFGYIYGATVENIGVTNIDITGNLYTGGLVGRNSDNSTVSNSYSTGSVRGTNDVGGLVGRNYSSTVSNSYSTGSASGTGTDDYVGGLVGNNYFSSTVSNSYSTGSVSGTGLVGGLVGYNYSSTVSNSYSTGSVSGTGDVGGLVGNNYSSTVSNSFWDTDSSGLSGVDDGVGNQTLAQSGVYGKTAAEMKAVATFTNETTVGLTTAWDFETNPNDDDANNDYWDLDVTETINNGYPYLSWEDGEDVSLPVELSSFTAENRSGRALLKWQTGSEQENLGFVIERKDNESK